MDVSFSEFLPLYIYKTIFNSQIYNIYRMSSLSKSLSVLVILLSSVFANWTTLAQGSMDVPGHIYKILLNANEILDGRLTWGMYADLDIYIYREGSNLLSYRETQARFLSEDGYKEVLRFTPSVSANYYIKIFPYSLQNNKMLSYSLNLTRSNNSTVYDNIFHINYLQSSAVLIPNELTYEKIGFRFSSNNLYVGRVWVTSPTSSPNLAVYGVGYESLVGCASGHFSDFWVLLLQTTYNYDVTLSSYTLYQLRQSTYTLQYYLDYPNCTYVIDVNTKIPYTQPTTQENLMSLQTLIVLCVVIPIVFVGVVGFLVVLLMRIYKKNRSQTRIEQLQIKNVIRKLESTNISLQFNDCCCICLGQNCDSSLPCNHYFHEECIKVWVSKNNKCPLCRNPVL